MEKGPYKHYERPEKGRAAGEKPNSGKAWGFIISVLIIILIALFPLTHHLAANNQEAKSQEPKEVQRTSSRKITKPKAKSSKKKSSANLQSKKVNKQISSSKSQSNSSSSKVKTYVVQSGDTLTSIAAQNNISVTQLAQLNGLDADSSIDAGQTLKLN